MRSVGRWQLAVAFSLGAMAMLGAVALFAVLRPRPTASVAPARRVQPQRASRDAGLHDSSRARAPAPRAPMPAPPRMFRLDARRTGRSGYTLPTDPRILARVRAQGRISTQPVMLPNGRILFGAHDGVVYAADPADGRIVWRANTGDRIYSSPLVADDGTVFIGSDIDRMFALSSAGAIGVALATSDDADTAPVRAPDGTLRFAAGRVLYATDADLTVRWRLEFGGKLFSSAAVLDDGTTLIGSQDDGVYAIDSTGHVRWRYAAGADVDATPAVDEGGVAYIGSDDGFVVALRVADGTRVWRTHVGGYVRSGAGLGLDGSVVVGTFGPRARIVALDAASGTLRWTHFIDGPPTADYGIMSSPLIDARGQLAVGLPDDAVIFLSPTGAVLRRIPMPADVDSSPVLIGDGLLAVGCDDGQLYLLGDVGATAGEPRDAHVDAGVEASALSR